METEKEVQKGMEQPPRREPDEVRPGQMKTYTVTFCNYTIGADAYEAVPAVCSRYGKRILLIGGEKALSAGRHRLLKALAGSGLAVVRTELFGADCTEGNIRRLAQTAEEEEADMIFGMGGGKALDTAKGCADRAGLPVFTFPTIAATCAATTALSVVYRENGSFDSFYYYDRPACHAFLDLSVIAAAPARYLQAGMGDALGKYFECHFSARGDRLEHGSALGREISNLCYAPLLEHGVQAYRDCLAGKVTEDLKEAVLANIVSTGLVSLLVLDDYNCAVAHSLDYGLILLDGFEEKFLHGNVVAYGVLVQLLLDGDAEEARHIKRFLKELEIPTTLREMGVRLDRDFLSPVLKETVNGPDMAHIPYPVTEDMVYAAMEAAEALDTSD